MATGLQTPGTSERYRLFRLIDGATTGNSAPTLATDGVELPEGRASHQLMQTERCLLCISDRSGSGTLSITYAKLWGYIADLGKWFPLGTGADADRGKLNGGTALGEVASDDLRLCEVVFDVLVFDRLFCEINTVGGTTPVFDVDLVIPKHAARYAK